MNPNMYLLQPKKYQSIFLLAVTLEQQKNKKYKAVTHKVTLQPPRAESELKGCREMNQHKQISELN